VYENYNIEWRAWCQQGLLSDIVTPILLPALVLSGLEAKFSDRVELNMLVNRQDFLFIGSVVLLLFI
jgi:hypothetical protein